MSDGVLVPIFGVVVAAVATPQSPGRENKSEA